MADNDAKNVRSVIKNATAGGLSDRLKGRNDTIATKEEIDESRNKVELPRATKINQLGLKIGPSFGFNSIGLNLKKGGNANKSEVSSQTNKSSPLQSTAGGVNVSQKPPVSSPFENNINTPINNINVEQVNNEKLQSRGNMVDTSKNKTDNIFINGVGRATDLKAPVDVDNAIMDLFLDVRGKVKNGTLAKSDLTKMKQVYPEFAGLKDEVLLAMIGDMGSMASNNLSMNDYNLKKFKSLYPELTSVSWGLAIPTQQNMYQAGGMKEAMMSASSIDLNNYGTAGAVAEGVINPIGEGFTLLDAAAQNLKQVDGNNYDATVGDWIVNPIGTAASKRAGSVETALKDKLASLTQDDINNYYKRYQQVVKEKPELMKLYTRQLVGDNVVEKLWNYYVKDKYVEDADAGFRSWMIDQVNNEVNGWKGEFWGASDEIKGVGGPNIAKMYANMPASAIKTTTAIANAMSNPLDTAQGLGVLVKDAYVNATNGTFSESLIGQRYGSWEAFAKAIEQDPVGVASDLLAVAELGTSAVKAVPGAARWGVKGASMATRAVGVEKTSSSLMKIADRLKGVEGKLGEFAKTTGGASDLGIRQLFYGLNGKGGLIGGLMKWAGEGDKFYSKAAKYMVRAQQPGKTTLEELKKVKEAGGPIGRLAEGITGVGDAEGKLFKAASPNLNTLRNNVDYKNKKANMDTATRAIVEAGYTPKTIEEWAKAHIDTLNSKWKEFKELIKDKKDVTVDAKELLRDVKSWLATEKEGATVNQRGDIAALEREIADLERRGSLDMDFLENRKEHYNSSYKDADKMKKGDIYEKGIKNIGNAIRKAQDNILGNGPESTKKLRNEIKALMDTKDDVQKANLRRQKQKEGGGLIENYGRISGLGDILEGAFKTVTGRIKEGVPQATKGVGKVILGKALGRAKDVDFLTETGFRGLKKKAESKGGIKTAIEQKGNGRKEIKMSGKEEKDYSTAVDKARAKVGDKEKALKNKEKKKVIEDAKKKAKNIGFVVEIEKDLKAGGGEKAMGLADIKNKIIKLSEDMTDTTAQHELFHAVMSVVDGKTRKYVIDEARKILKEKGMSDVNVEEWLAESFGIYAKRKQVNLGVLDKVKWGDGKIRAVVGDLFQRVYEWLQNYNGDRKTINKLFDEILDDKVKIGENGGVDLSYLLEGKDVEGKGLKGKDGLRYKKDLSNKDSSGRSLSEGQTEYFKNSKARDKDGNLIRVYHGTRDKFNAFDENKIDKKGNYFGAGFYFTDDVASARDYGGLVKEGYLNIEKMFDMSKYYTEAEYNGLLRELGLSKDELPAYKTKDGEYHLVSGYERDTFRRQGDNSYNFDGGRLTEALKKAGYDGIMGEIGDEREFVVFNSNQFKNIDNLNPTKSEDIRYKKAKDSDKDGISGGKGIRKKEVKITGNGGENEYLNKDILNPNQNKYGLIKKSKDDTGKSKKNLQGLGKKEKNTNQGGVGGKASQKARNDGGRVPQGDGGYLELKTSGKDIVKTLEKIKGEQPEGFKMDIHGSADYENGKWKTFQSKDGNSSVTIKDDGDITSLVSKKGLGRGKELVLTAIKNGGDKLDCYEDKLPDLYQRGGFEPVARVKFNPEYAPADWKGKGQDIIVMMRRNNDSVDKVAENWGKYEKIDLDDLPVMDYDTALEFRDMLLEERKLADKNGGTKTKPIWEEEINPKTGEKYTKDEVKKEMEKIRDKYLNDENKLRKLYDNYKKINSEFNADKDPIIEKRFDRNGYINPDGLRPLINKEFAEEIGVGDNVLASTNHPAVSKIADAFVEMISKDMVAKAMRGDNVMVALIGGGGGSGKSGGPKAMVSEGFVKEGERVDMTLDVQGGGDDLEKLIEEAKKEGVLDKFSFKIAYIYASTRDAGGGAIKRTISQNKKILEKMGINPETVAKDTDIGKNRLYAGRSLPLDVFEGGHIKSASEEKGLRKYIALAQEIGNLDLMITERVNGDRNNTTKHIVKKDGEWKISDDDLNYLVDKIVKNKEEGLSKIKDDLEKDGREAVEKGQISKRQFQDFFGKAFSLAFVIMLLGGNDEDEEIALV